MSAELRGHYTQIPVSPTLFVSNTLFLLLGQAGAYADFIQSPFRRQPRPTCSLEGQAVSDPVNGVGDNQEKEDPEEISKGEKSKGEGEDEEGDEEDEPRSSDKIEQVPTIAPLPLA